MNKSHTNTHTRTCHVQELDYALYEQLHQRHESPQSPKAKQENLGLKVGEWNGWGFGSSN